MLRTLRDFAVALKEANALVECLCVCNDPDAVVRLWELRYVLQTLLADVRAVPQEAGSPIELILSKYIGFTERFVELQRLIEEAPAEQLQEVKQFGPAHFARALLCGSFLCLSDVRRAALKRLFLPGQTGQEALLPLQFYTLEALGLWRAAGPHRPAYAALVEYVVQLFVLFYLVLFPGARLAEPADERSALALAHSIARGGVSFLELHAVLQEAMEQLEPPAVFRLHPRLLSQLLGEQNPRPERLFGFSIEAFKKRATEALSLPTLRLKNNMASSYAKADRWFERTFETVNQAISRFHNATRFLFGWEELAGCVKEVLESSLGGHVDALCQVQFQQIPFTQQSVEELRAQVTQYYAPEEDFLTDVGAYVDRIALIAKHLQLRVPRIASTREWTEKQFSGVAGDRLSVSQQVWQLYVQRQATLMPEELEAARGFLAIV